MNSRIREFQFKWLYIVNTRIIIYFVLNLSLITYVLFVEKKGKPISIVFYTCVNAQV